jgi:hypothetical protein
VLTWGMVFLFSVRVTVLSVAHLFERRQSERSQGLTEASAKDIR